MDRTTAIKLDPPARERLAPHRDHLLKAADQTDRVYPDYRAVTAHCESRVISAPLIDDPEAAKALRDLDRALREQDAESIFAPGRASGDEYPEPGRWVLRAAWLA